MDRETPTFAGLMMSLRKFRNRLTEVRNFKLNTNPREIDVRIIDKANPDTDRMDNAIAYIFERHNLIELKNPHEPLNIDVVWKGISYAAQYKSMGKDDFTKEQGIDIIPMKNITLTFLRISKPLSLFKSMSNYGYKIEEKFPGVYYVSGMADIKMQIVVGKELEGDDFVPLRVQHDNLSLEDAGKFIKMVSVTNEIHDKELMDIILQLSVTENKSIYNHIREEMPEMCDALREIMKEDLAERYRVGKSIGLADGRIEGLETAAMGMLRENDSADKIIRITGVTPERLAVLRTMM